MSVRSTVVALAVVALAPLVMSPSPADGGGHAPAQAVMDRTVQLDGAPGVLGQAKEGGSGWQGSAGVADRRSGQPRSARETFRIGSLTKPFVATVLLQLEAEGRLSLDDPVERWLPGRLHGRGNDGRRVTVRQLLGHTSGVFSYTGDPGFERSYVRRAFPVNRFRGHTAGGLVRTALRHRPDFAPGSDWEYSNTNYVLAGMVIQRVTGHPYGTEIDRRLVRPLRLSHTSLPGHSAHIPGPNGRAYTAVFTANAPHGRVRDVTALNPSMAGASGEMLSSTGDLVRFFRALARGELLPTRQLREMRQTVPAEDGARYGLGLSERRLPCGVTVLGHDGTILGSRTVAATTPDGSHTAAFNVNADWTGDTRSLVDAEFCAADH